MGRYEREKKSAPEGAKSGRAATNWSLAYVASLGGWENTEILNKCYGGIPEHIKAQIAKSLHVRFDTMNLNTSAMIQPVKFL